jgi:hypothetical protein
MHDIGFILFAAIDVWMNTCMAFVFFSLVEFIASNFMHRLCELKSLLVILFVIIIIYIKQHDHLQQWSSILSKRNRL